MLEASRELAEIDIERLIRFTSYPYIPGSALWIGSLIGSLVCMKPLLQQSPLDSRRGVVK